MHRFVLDLFLGSAHKVTNSGLGIFSPVGFHVVNLHIEQFAVESVQQGHQEVLLAFDPEVAVSIVEAPGIGTRLSKHEEIFSASNEPQSNESS